MPESSSSRDHRSEGGEIATSTLAEIYAQQGLIGRALSIYRRMLARAPADSRIADRIRSLETRMAEVGPETPVESPAGPSATRERLPWDPPDVEQAAPESVAAADAVAASDSVGFAGVAAADTRAEPPAEVAAEPPRKVGRMDPHAFQSWLSRR